MIIENRHSSLIVFKTRGKKDLRFLPGLTTVDKSAWEEAIKGNKAAEGHIGNTLFVVEEKKKPKG